MLKTVKTMSVCVYIMFYALSDTFYFYLWFRSYVNFSNPPASERQRIASEVGLHLFCVDHR